MKFAGSVIASAIGLALFIAGMLLLLTLQAALLGAI